MQNSKKPAHSFKVGENVVHPSHGVAEVVAIETKEIAGFSLEMYVLSVPEEKLLLRVPCAKAATVGIRSVADEATVDRAIGILTESAKRSRGMWARRATDIDAKINSGDILLLAEVVRDLSRAEDETGSYSERMLLESARQKMLREIAASRGITATEAGMLIDNQTAGRTPARANAA